MKLYIINIKMKSKDYYKILQIDRTADSQEIKKAFRKLAKIHHPDKNPGDENASNVFKSIIEAYEILKDPIKRKAYDKDGKGIDKDFIYYRTKEKRRSNNSYTESNSTHQRYYYSQSSRNTIRSGMKKLHIIGLIIVAISIVGIVLFSQDYTTYETFKTATEKQGKDIKVVGNLVLDKPIEYDPKTNANLFTFYMKDKENEVHKVVFKGAQPQDFRRSEQLVLTGKMQGDEFYSSNILMKCPSKYVDNEIKEVKEASLMPPK